MARVLPAYLLAAIAAFIALSAMAHPNLAPCVGNTWTVGDNTNMAAMGVAKFGNGAGGACVLAGAPAEYNPCHTYEITLTSANSFGHKAQVSLGSLSANSESGTSTRSNGNAGNCRSTGDNVLTKSTKYVWTAPNTLTAGNTEFFALCGNQNVNILVAPKLTATVNATAEPFASGCPEECLGDACDVLASSSASFLSSSAASVMTLMMIVMALFM